MDVIPSSFIDDEDEIFGFLHVLIKPPAAGASSGAPSNEIESLAGGGFSSPPTRRRRCAITRLTHSRAPQLVGLAHRRRLRHHSLSMPLITPRGDRLLRLTD